MALRKRIDLGSAAEVVGFVLVVGGVASFNVAVAAIVAGVALIVFGGIRQ